MVALSNLRAGEELDLLIGGPPCQGYSSSNRAEQKPGKDEKNQLMRVFLDKVSDLCPKMFLVENVQGVQWTEPTEDMHTEAQQLSLFTELDVGIKLDSVQQFMIQRSVALGYRVWYRIIDAADFGVPQHRMRFFLFGIRADLIPNEENVDLYEYPRKFIVAKHTTVAEAIGDLPSIENGAFYEGKYKPKLNQYVERMRKYLSNRQIYDHFTTRHKDYVIERYKNIQHGENWEAIRELMTNYASVENTHSNIYRRLRNDMPANTITHYRKSMIIHPTQDRGLSFREACRLQSFPDWFRFEGGREEMQQQLANAVPPLLASKVAYSIADFWYERFCNFT
jgi:DNA-cytosine methyltransferase